MDERIMPLINIVFLLLIFFMVAGRLGASDPFDVIPPETGHAEAARLEGVEILLGADGALALDRREVDRATLMAELARRLGDAPGTRLRLRADQGGEARALVTLMQELRALGAREVTLVTRPGPR
jgi:biopolymer transport protein ExbD